MKQHDDNYFMSLALEEARSAMDAEEVPVGAVIVSGEGEIISYAFNTVEKDGSCIMHAEIKAILEAQKTLNNWRLEECSLYVTLEPCIMCCGAIILSRITKLVYGTLDPKGGSSSMLLNDKIEVVSGIMKEESSLLLRNFFKSKRDKRRHE